MSIVFAQAQEKISRYVVYPMLQFFVDWITFRVRSMTEFLPSEEKNKSKNFLFLRSFPLFFRIRVYDVD